MNKKKKIKVALTQDEHTYLIKDLERISARLENLNWLIGATRGLLEDLGKEHKSLCERKWEIQEIFSGFTIISVQNNEPEKAVTKNRRKPTPTISKELEAILAKAGKLDIFKKSLNEA